VDFCQVLLHLVQDDDQVGFEETQAFNDAIEKALFSNFVPDIFDRIEFRRIGRQPDAYFGGIAPPFRIFGNPGGVEHAGISFLLQVPTWSSLRFASAWNPPYDSMRCES
jgi:hypothetical protein